MKNGAGPACHQFVLYCRGYLEVNWHGKRKETWQQAIMGGRHDCGDCLVSIVKIVDRARHDGIKAIEDTPGQLLPRGVFCFAAAGR